MKSIAFSQVGLAFAASLFCCRQSLAQDSLGGYVIWDSPEVYEALPLSMPPHDMAPSSSYFVDYSPFVPLVEQSGATCGAVQFTLAVTMGSFFRDGIPAKPGMATPVKLAYEFLFTLAAGDCGKGIEPDKLIKTLGYAGIAPRRDYRWDSNCWLGIERLPSSDAREAALDFREPVVKRLWDLAASDLQKITAGEVHLRRKALPIVCFAAKPPTCIQTKSWKPTPLSSPDEPGHAMLLSGFYGEPGNEGEGVFILANSFGTRCHDKGFVKMSYADFGKFARCAYVVGNVSWNMGTDENCPLFLWESMSGSVEILSKTAGKKAFSFTVVQPDDTRQGWKTHPAQWQAGKDSFQLKLHVPAGLCASVIAMQPSEPAQAWWQTEGQVPADTSLLLPFSFAVPNGTTHLVVLFSLYPFADLDRRLAVLKSAPDCRAQLDEAFGCWLLRKGAYRREDYSMAFHPPLQAKGHGMAVPLILRLEGRR